MFISTYLTPGGLWMYYRFPYSIALADLEYNWRPADSKGLGSMRFQGEAHVADPFAVRSKLSRLGEKIKLHNNLKTVSEIVVGAEGGDSLQVRWEEPKWPELDGAISASFCLPLIT